MEHRVCFVGMSTTAVGWYRCYLPAEALGADWVGLRGEPPTLRLETGLVGPTSRRETRMPVLKDYDIVVLQQPRGNGWLRVIRQLQSEGVKVVYEVDDYLHAISKVVGHDYKRDFDRDELGRLELTMRVCDAVICSTDYIAKRYRKFNRRTYVCQNGVDLARYRLTVPPRDGDRLNIGWAGATGHDQAMGAWITAVANTMLRNERTNFVSVGHDYASTFLPHFPGRALGVPFTLLDNYPAAMTMFDVALAPVARASGGQVHQFFRGKSDLRWVEAGALGIPTICDPDVYPEVEHGVTGFHAVTGKDLEELLELVFTDHQLRIEVGRNAQEYVKEHRSIVKTCHQWERVFDDLVAGGPPGNGSVGRDSSSVR